VNLNNGSETSWFDPELLLSQLRLVDETTRWPATMAVCRRRLGDR
jgi:hypothetical protein